MPFIYAILDRNTDEVIYVGSTTNSVDRRFNQNIIRLNNVIPEGVEPIVKTIQWCSSKERFSVEGAYIDLFKEQGCSLINTVLPIKKSKLTLADKLVRLKARLTYCKILTSEIQLLLHNKNDCTCQNSQPLSQAN